KARQKETIPTGTLDPGMEWAMSSFHHLLLGGGLVPGLVSSSLVTLSAVPVDEVLPQEILARKQQLQEEARDHNTAATDKQAIVDRLYEDCAFKTTKAYALQITPEIQGEFLGTFLENALKNPTLFDELDKTQVQSLILSALLTHPADAKGDNYIVTSPDAR